MESLERNLQKLQVRVKEAEDDRDEARREVQEHQAQARVVRHAAVQRGATDIVQYQLEHEQLRNSRFQTQREAYKY